MRKAYLIILILSLMSACTNTTDLTATQIPPSITSANTLPGSTSTPEPESVDPTAAELVVTSTLAAPTDDFFTEMGTFIPAPGCSVLTQQQTEGPYYIPDSPEKHSLLEEGLTGTRLILVGYVLDQDCVPQSNAWLDFWQADANGEYDNAGYRLRGHQFTDRQGRYYLETILPGLYSSRPLEHIHVKVRPEGGGEVTSQLYFPQRPIEGLTVTIEERNDYMIGYFNFVVQK
ncbi:MAG: intradiol ring-cleavage dioxygenase [Anaerolineales bacterium]